MNSLVAATAAFVAGNPLAGTLLPELVVSTAADIRDAHRLTLVLPRLIALIDQHEAETHRGHEITFETNENPLIHATNPVVWRFSVHRAVSFNRHTTLPPSETDAITVCAGCLVPEQDESASVIFCLSPSGRILKASGGTEQKFGDFARGSEYFYGVGSTLTMIEWTVQQLEEQAAAKKDSVKRNLI